jgi:hypothetical protein
LTEHFAFGRRIERDSNNPHPAYTIFLSPRSTATWRQQKFFLRVARQRRAQADSEV